MRRKDSHKDLHREPAGPASPITFPVHVARLPQKGMPVRIVATDEQKRELARLHGVDEINDLRIDVTVTPWKRNGIRISGRILANMVQSCVVTLDPLKTKVDETFEGLFLPEDSKLGRLGFGAGGEIVIDPEGDDSPETFHGDSIDVGALAEEYFGMAIDPYPRKEGVQLEVSADEAPDGHGQLAEKLARLKADRES